MHFPHYLDILDVFQLWRRQPVDGSGIFGCSYLHSGSQLVASKFTRLRSVVQQQQQATEEAWMCDASWSSCKSRPQIPFGTLGQTMRDTYSRYLFTGTIFSSSCLAFFFKDRMKTGADIQWCCCSTPMQ